MTTALWAMAGALLGWIGYSFLGVMRGTGMIFSILVGAISAVLGGKVIAPMFVDATAVVGAFSVGATLVAIAVAVSCLAIGTLIHHRMSA